MSIDTLFAILLLLGIPSFLGIGYLAGKYDERRAWNIRLNLISARS